MVGKWIVVLLTLLLASPALAQVSLNVDQTHTLSWDWQSEGSPVRSFVFRCGAYRKDVVDADARAIAFGSLIDAPGTYTGCTIAAQNEAGLSAPVAVPNFEYAYSYGALGRLLLELAATLGASVTLIRRYGKTLLLSVLRAVVRPPTPLALPEPLTILQQTERTHAHRHS